MWNSIRESCRFSTGALSFGNYGVGNSDDADTQEGGGNNKAREMHMLMRYQWIYKLAICCMYIEF